MTVLTHALVVAAVLGAGLVTGLLFIFSNTVMAALAEQEPDVGARVMVSINRIILNPTFIAFFMGTLIVSVVAAGVALWTGHDARSWIVAGAAGYAVLFVITAAGNVPLNERLDALPLGTPESRELWADYLTRWTRLNTQRTLAGMASIVAFALALLHSSPP
jgi:uncharacterized membrane protein